MTTEILYVIAIVAVALMVGFLLGYIVGHRFGYEKARGDYQAVVGYAQGSGPNAYGYGPGSDVDGLDV